MRRDEARRVGEQMRDGAMAELDHLARRSGAFTELDAEQCRLQAAWALLGIEHRRLLTWALADQSRLIERGHYRDTFNDHGTAALDRARADLENLLEPI